MYVPHGESIYCKYTLEFTIWFDRNSFVSTPDIYMLLYREYEQKRPLNANIKSVWVRLITDWKQPCQIIFLSNDIKKKKNLQKFVNVV